MLKNYYSNTFVNEVQKKASDYLSKKRSKDANTNNKNNNLIFESGMPLKTRFKINNKYTEEDFNKKLSYDIKYHNFLMSNIEEDDKKINSHLSKMVNSLKEIYECGLLYPRVYGFRDNYDNLIEIDENEDCDKIVSKEFYNYLNSNYYNLNKDRLVKKYGEPVVYESKNQIIDENTSDIEEVTRKNLKKIILENFIDNISFPGFTKNHIKECIENEEFTKLFDVDRIQELLDDYDKYKSKYAELLSEYI